jgi:hypothetical protein
LRRRRKLIMEEELNETKIELKGVRNRERGE